MSLILFPEPGPRVFAAPPGLPFARAVADGVLSRLRAVDAGPEGLAEVEIVVSTRRAHRDLRAAFLAAAGGACLGPRIRGLGEIGEDPSLPCDAPPAIERTRRTLLLTKLVRTLLAADPSLGAPPTAPRLAADLGALLEQAEAEGVSLDRLEEITTDDHARHWAASKAFLDIVRRYWPAELAEIGRSDPAARRRRAVAALEELWTARPPKRPVLVAGSPTDASAARFIALAARLPQGAALLPGFDAEMDAATAAELRRGASPEHPQTAFVQLLERIGVGSDDVSPWAADDRPHAGPRLRLLGQTMRPAPVTDAWRAAAGALAGEAKPATEGVSLVEAAGPREEASAIALLLREALETPGRLAALITPDRVLARRVSAELARWGLEADDSSGRPLPLTPPGVFFGLVAETALGGGAPAALTALAKHPLAAAGFERGPHLRAARRFERHVLRAHRGAATFDQLGDAARRRAEIERSRAAEATADPTAPDAAEELALDVWFDAVAAALAPLAALAEQETAPLAELLAAHRHAAEALSHRPDQERLELYERAAGEALATTLADLEAHADALGPIAPAEYPGLLAQLLGQTAVREAFGRHPRVLILGPLEARMQSADLVVLGGLNDGIWPPIPEPDPWISRTMRAELGLPPLEARIGLSAHDFFQAAMAETVVLTRSRKADGSPTVASRWLMRLTNLLEGVAPDALARMRARGERPLALARRLDDPAAPHLADAPFDRTPAERPRPTPPVAARPTRLSATEVETLIRDPYAVYARRVLRLRALPKLGEEPDARDRGDALHQLLERFVRHTRDWEAEALETPEATALYDEMTAEALAPFAEHPTLHALWSARAAQMRAWLLAGEAERRRLGRPTALEAMGALTLEGPFGEVELTAAADRIDKLADPELGAGYAIYDYKTGAPPSAKQVAAFAKQLPLEAAILSEAGFDGAAKGVVAKLAHLRLRGGEIGGEEHVLDGDAMEHAAEALDGLRRLLTAYADPDQPYLSRARPQFLEYESDYDHLARVGEWADGSEEGARQPSAPRAERRSAS